jgi:outer membrane protein insertion porin family
MSAAEIGKITFVQDSEYKFPDQMLFFNIQQKVGSQFNDKTLNEDIKRLYSTGFFTDVLSETTVEEDGKINIILKITPRPRIKVINFEGNKKFKREKLDKELTIVADQPLSDAKLRESTNKLRKFYMSEGFNDALLRRR